MRTFKLSDANAFDCRDRGSPAEEDVTNSGIDCRKNANNREIIIWGYSERLGWNATCP